MMNNLPNESESNVINDIAKYNDEDYVLIRLTSTMLMKSIIQ